MPSQVARHQSMPRLPKSKTPIRDHNHALQIARGIDFGDLLKNGGSIHGFADWLFVLRKKFNGTNPLQQAKVYASARRAALKKGLPFDSLFSDRAEEKARQERQSRADAATRYAAMLAYWVEIPIGIEITAAVAELCLGRGSRFATVRDGEAQPPPMAWGLEYLLEVLERFGGPDEALDRYDWSRELAEKHFSQCIPGEDPRLEAIRAKISRGELPSEADIICITWCAYWLSCLSRVRTMLRPLLRQVSMAEQIEASGHLTAPTGPAPTRRQRGV